MNAENTAACNSPRPRRAVRNDETDPRRALPDEPAAKLSAITRKTAPQRTSSVTRRVDAGRKAVPAPGGVSLDIPLYGRHFKLRFRSDNVYSVNLSHGDHGSFGGSWHRTAFELLRVYEYCGGEGIGMYGGGQFELGAGRGQIEYLASLYHPAGANDVAPLAYHTWEAAARLPSSPLPVSAAPTGFRWQEPPAVAAGMDSGNPS